MVLGLSEDPDRQLKEGKVLAKKAVELDPRDAIGYFALGRIHMVQGNHDDSIAALKYSLELNPNFAHSYFGLGMAFMLAGDLDEARERLQAALKMRGPTIFLGCVKSNCIKQFL